MVLKELAPSQAHKIRNRSDLESELFSRSDSASGAINAVRDNEGEAAEYGIYFDDTEYDYMQHVRDMNLGTSDGESYFVEASIRQKDGKGKAKVSLEDALREASIGDNQSENGATFKEKSLLVDDELLPSRSLRKGTYQDQQNVPDALAGFQPDMDPRLREALEALDDDAYVDNEEDFFGDITKGAKEITSEEFEEIEFAENGDEDGGWETDDTEKPSKEYKTGDILEPPSLKGTDTAMEDTADHGDGDWMKEFSKFKKAQPAASNANLQSSIMTGTSMIGGRRRKRKGAMTSSTGYSMTSSSLFRTEGQNLLDARFDKIEEEYAEGDMDMDDGGASIMTGTSTASSQVPPLTTRSDFDNMMDDFLNDYSMNGKKRFKKGGYQSGLEQLSELRKGLGPARVKTQKV